MSTRSQAVDVPVPYLVEHSKSVVLILTEEFGTPFVLYRRSTGTTLSECHEDQRKLGLPDNLESRPQFATFQDPIVRELEIGRFEIWIPLREASQTVLVAATVIKGFARDAEESNQERRRMGKWVHSVRSRIEHAIQSTNHRKSTANEDQTSQAWASLVAMENLLRRTQFLADPEANQRRILKVLADLFTADAVAWVPHSVDSEVILHGDCQISTWGCRQFACALASMPDLHRQGMLVVNDVANCDWSSNYPVVKNLLSVQVADQRMPGHLIVINKREKPASTRTSQAHAESTGGMAEMDAEDDEQSPKALLLAFRRSDAALLTPFVTLMSTQLRSAKRHRELKDLLVSLTRSLTSSIDAKDPYTMGHSERVGRIAVELARELGMRGDDLSDVYLAGLLHDIGKIGIRDSVLLKPGFLDPEEYEHMKKHVTIGYQILSDVHAIKHLLPGVLHHHERYDGKGYPHQLAGEAIPFLARILAVADSFDAMHTTRPYRSAMNINRVEEIFREESGKQWDAQVVDALFRCKQRVYAIRDRGVGDSLRQALDNVLHESEPLGTIGALGILPQAGLPV